MCDRVNDKDLSKGSQTVSPVAEEKKSPLYLFMWLPREDAGLSATGGPCLSGCGDKNPSPCLHQSQPLN